MTNERTLDISWETILKVAVSFFCFYIFYLIKDILILFVFALIISILLNPAIGFLQRRRIPRALAVIFVYVFIFGISILFIFQTAPIFISEIQQFGQLFPQYFEKVSPSLRLMGLKAFENFEIFTKTLQDWLSKASSSIFGAVGAIFGGIFSTITVFTLAIFLSFEEKGTERILSLFSPKKYEAYILDLWQKSQNKVSAWFGVRILSCIFFMPCYVPFFLRLSGLVVRIIDFCRSLPGIFDHFSRKPAMHFARYQNRPDRALPNLRQSCPGFFAPIYIHFSTNSSRN